MILVPDGTRTPRPGRPILTHCKRGHKREPRRRCKLCCSLRYREKYQRDEAFREHKKALAVAYRKAFRAEHGYSASEQYR
jgi:hypothetical protein